VDVLRHTTNADAAENDKVRGRVFRWYLAAFLTFWGTVTAVDSIAYLGSDRGPGGASTPFESLLQIPLLLGVITGGCLHAVAVIKTAIQFRSAAGVLLALFGGALFGALNFVAFAIVQLCFVINVMQWDSL
jgi:hypothetical protein